MIKFESRIFTRGGELSVSKVKVVKHEDWDMNEDHNFSMSYGMAWQDSISWGIGIEVVITPRLGGWINLAPMIVINKRGYYLALTYTDGR
jgi:hypothetical protein